VQLRDLKNLVDKTADAAFVIDHEGVIVAWNPASEAMFNLKEKEALGRTCGDILQGSDECGAVCSRDCSVKQAVRRRHPVTNYDIEVSTSHGRRWCNVSVLFAEVASASGPYAIHIIRTVDMRKRLELLLRDFIVTSSGIPADSVRELIATTRAPARETELSPREREVLGLIAKGVSTRGIAEQLHVSNTTVNNHVQHILRKLNAHSRLEAVRRAERAGLV
jgi:PAS domain S-box-containing protein